MSKSRGNVVSPDDYIEKYGSDVFRMYLMFGFTTLRAARGTTTASRRSHAFWTAWSA